MRVCGIIIAVELCNYVFVRFSFRIGNNTFNRLSLHAFKNALPFSREKKRAGEDIFSRLRNEKCRALLCTKLSIQGVYKTGLYLQKGNFAQNLCGLAIQLSLWPVIGSVSQICSPVLSGTGLRHQGNPTREVPRVTWSRDLVEKHRSFRVALAQLSLFLPLPVQLKW